MESSGPIIDSTAAGLKKFGFVVGGFLGIVAGVSLWRGKTAGWPLAAISLFILSFAAIAPLRLKTVQRVWMTAAFAIGSVVTCVVLLLVYYLLLTPVALLARVLGHDFLRGKVRSDADSFWLDSEMTREDKEYYEHQF